MTGRPPKITGALREELWRRYKAGETILAIGRALGQRQTTIHRVLQATGGIAPALRSRFSRVLRFDEREEISRGVAAGQTFRAIARGLHRAVSTALADMPLNSALKGGPGLEYVVRARPVTDQVGLADSFVAKDKRTLRTS